jgi:Fe-S cluster assembly protein SufD
MSQFNTLFTEQKTQQDEKLAKWQRSQWLALGKYGVPHIKHEDWKYTSLEQLHSTDLDNATRAKCDLAKMNSLKLDVDATRLVFVDGLLDTNLSSKDLQHWEISDLTDDTIEQYQCIKPEVFSFLTDAFAKQLLEIKLADNQIAEKPLYLLHINTCVEGGMEHYSHRINIGQSAAAKVIEHHVALDDNAHKSDLCTSRIAFKVGQNAQLSHINLITQHNQTQHFSHNDITLDKDSRADSYSFLLSGDLIRHNTSSYLNGENVELSMNSLSLPVAEQTYDSRTYLHHDSAHCNSQQLHKTIAQDHASATFNGMILVSEEAIKTDGQMDNHNLLLSDNVQVNSKPQLEIYADDVKCSHGCTTGALSKEQLFYLMARGISKKNALKTLVYAFAGEVLDELPITEINDKLLALIASKLESTEC